MRRAVIVAAATVVGLVALLDYRSSSSSSAGRKVSIGGATTVPTTAAPSAPSTTAPSAPSTSPSARSSSQTYNGEDVTYRYGDIEVRVVVAGGQITAIDIPEESANDPRSQSINSQAVPILTREALAAQGADIDVVSGATYTSDAFAQSLQSALEQEGK